MNNRKTENFETALRAKSLVSEFESGLVWELLSLDSTGDELDLSRQEELFLARFSDEGAFAEVIQDAMATQGQDRATLCETLSLPEKILEKVLNFNALPNIIPVKKMNRLLVLLHIPLGKAVNSIRTSLRRFTVDGSALQPIPAVSMKQNWKYPIPSPNSTQSKESLKRNIEVYIQRLTEEGEENESC